jgi:preprotein translocase subunit SecG
MVLFGLFVAATMALVMLRHRHNQKERDWTQDIGQHRSSH